MHATTVGIDLAKDRFELAITVGADRPPRRERLSRQRFARFFANLPPGLIVMEACGSAHFWSRALQAQGHEVRLLPAQYVRAYVRRNKTDAADAAALLEAARCPTLRVVPVKSVEQQQLQQLHRVREQLKITRTARINLLRGILREFGIAVPVGLARGRAAVREALEIADNGLPDLLRPMIAETLQEITALTERITRLEATLTALTRSDPIVQRLLELPGVGLLGASALRAAVGDIQRFPTGRHFASWLGLTATERSSGERRRLGRISKQGDVYSAHSAGPRGPLGALRGRQGAARGAVRSIDCALGRSPPSSAAAATRPPSRSPTSSLGSSGPPGATSVPSTATGQPRPSRTWPAEGPSINPCLPPLHRSHS